MKITRIIRKLRMMALLVLNVLFLIPNFVNGMLLTKEQALVQLQEYARLQKQEGAEKKGNSWSLGHALKEDDVPFVAYLLEHGVQAQEIPYFREFDPLVQFYKIGKNQEIPDYSEINATQKFRLQWAIHDGELIGFHNYAAIYYARSVCMAGLLLQHKADLPQNLLFFMGSGYSPDLIPFYVQLGVDPKKSEKKRLRRSILSCSSDYYVTPFHELVLRATEYQNCIPEALKKAALLNESGAEINVIKTVLYSGQNEVVSDSSMRQKLESDINYYAIDSKRVAVLKALLAFINTPKTYRQICIQQFAGNRSLPQAIRCRELGIK